MDVMHANHVLHFRKWVTKYPRGSETSEQAAEGGLGVRRAETTGWLEGGKGFSGAY